jgi:hypothetical protein
MYNIVGRNHRQYFSNSYSYRNEFETQLRNEILFSMCREFNTLVKPDNSNEEAVRAWLRVGKLY